MYRGIASFQEYVLISQRRRQVERFQRQPAGPWLMTVYKDSDILELETAGCKVPLDTLSEDIGLDSN